MSEQQIFGERFQLISELSSGGFGQTFLAEDLRSLNKLKCVVKQLKPQSRDSQIIELSKRLFEQEVRILYQVGEHPQIPSIITHFEEDNEFYFVQEYIEGNTFAQELSQGKIYNQRQVIEIITELLSVLAFVHNRDVIHRDIKPSNLICRKSDGKTVLIDFGAVKQVGNQTNQNSSQTTKGTIAIGSEGYMPMEQIAGHPRFSSDVYAVGMFAIQLLTNTHPTKLRQNQRTGEWIWQDKVSVNNQFAEFINEMIRYDYRQRFTDASEALNYLRKLNLNAGKSAADNYYSNGNKGVDFGDTQATFFSPAAIQPQVSQANKSFVDNRNFAPLHQNQENYYQQQSQSPNHLQNYNTKAVTQIVHPININSNQQIGKIDLTLGGSYFDNFWGTALFRRLLSVCIIGLVCFGIFTSSFVSDYISENYPSNPMSQPLPPPPQPKRVNEPGAFIRAAEKRGEKAKTRQEWLAVAEDWKRAEAYYSSVEDSAVSETERLQAAADQARCARGADYANLRSTQSENNK